MAEYRATIQWTRGSAAFRDGKYSRGHTWAFDGGVSVAASSSPKVVPPPMSVEAAVDPEEAFVASLASCHMLWFLFFAGKGGFVVDRYQDEAVGTMARNERGKLAMSTVVLRPAIAFSGEAPAPEALADLHHRAHEECYIANSVKTEVRVEPRPSAG